MKNLFVLSVVFLMVACGPRKDVQINVIPKPAKVETGKGSFLLNEKTVIVAKTDDEKKVSHFLTNALKKFNGLQVTEGDAVNNAIVLSIDGNSGMAAEAYRMVVSKNGVRLTASSPAGLFYGVQSLIQLCGTGKDISIPCMTIEDKPRFAWRGMHLDEARHFQGKEFVKKFIDMLAMHKLNVLHWHLTDDQGWRIEIKRYPKLTSIGAWREDRRGEPWSIDDDQRLPYDTSKPFYGGFYTQDDIREIVAYAAERYITIVPEIEMPGHSRAALVAYPEVSCFGKEKKVPPGGYVGEHWDFSDPYCAGKEETFVFLQHVLDEVISLFPSPYIHIGGDECTKRVWKKCPLCQARIKKEKLKDEFELQSYFIRRIEKYLASKGKRMIGWQEIMEGGMDPSALIMPWRGDDALPVALEAAQKGHQVIMVPSSYLYFNGDWESMELSHIYHYDPIPEGLDSNYHAAIIGLEACIWGENTPSFREVEYQTMPRMAALAEIGWTPKEKKDWKDFVARVEKIKALYKQMDINYYVPSPRGLPEKTVFTATATVAFDTVPEGLLIRYTTDSSEPSVKSSLYEKPFEISSTTLIKAAAFDRYGQKSKTVVALFEKQSFRKAVSVPHAEKGLRYFIYAGRFRGADLIDKAIPCQTGVTDTLGALVKNGDKDGGIRFEGYVEVPADGIYTFSLASNDGSKLYIGDYLVTDNDGYRSAFSRRGEMILSHGSIALAKGMHPLVVKYFDWGSGEYLKVFIEGPGISRRELKDIIFH